MVIKTIKQLIVALVLITPWGATTASLYRGLSTLYRQPSMLGRSWGGLSQASQAFSSSPRVGAPISDAQMADIAQDVADARRDAAIAQALQNPMDLQELLRVENIVKQAAEASAPPQSGYTWAPSDKNRALSALWGKIHATRGGISNWLAQQEKTREFFAQPENLRTFYAKKPGMINQLLGSKWVPHSVRAWLPETERMISGQPTAAEIEQMASIENLADVMAKGTPALGDLQRAADVAWNQYKAEPEGSERKSEMSSLWSRLNRLDEGTKLRRANEALGVAPAHVEADLEWAENVVKNPASTSADLKRAQDIIWDAYKIAGAQDIIASERYESDKTGDIRSLWSKANRRQEGQEVELANQALGISPSDVLAGIPGAEAVLQNPNSTLDEIIRAERLARDAYALMRANDVLAGEKYESDETARGRSLLLNLQDLKDSKKA